MCASDLQCGKRVMRSGKQKEGQRLRGRVAGGEAGKEGRVTQTGLMERRWRGSPSGFQSGCHHVSGRGQGSLQGELATGTASRSRFGTQFGGRVGRLC